MEKLGVGKWCDWLETKTAIRPNHITSANIGVGVLATVCLYNNVILTSMLLGLMLVVDGFDGYYAVRNKLTSRLGERLDHGGDLFIGIIMLLKSFWYFGEWWILLALIMFSGEAILIWLKGWGKIKFPERDFIYLFVFGWYWQGLVVQVILQPLILLNFLRERRC